MTTTTPKFRRADGQLTAYALGCGYCQTYAVDGATDYYGTTADAVTLRRDGCYHVHVRAGSLTHDERGAARRVDGDRVDWYVFDALADARRFYARVRRALRTGAPLTLDALRALDPTAASVCDRCAGPHRDGVHSGEICEGTR
ncbi:hypothetical protein QLT00_gp86 [Gordonia phage Commandaria]|uniref:Uncharacterized protein n=1 Tax=Gordonia phage Commandaria TaxID=3038364 RepID=A0AAF0GJG8_9CAUD|nr:hypothetical protein QLT00_gp86 [Gordonia phage Commandaria]WGH20869.1 hypothetical protein [Gordonia phage Commandaria]